MGVEWSSDPHAFAEPSWQRLVDADPDATPFHTPRYLKRYWEELGEGDLLIARVLIGGENVAAAAFELHGDRLRWLGGTEVTDYLGPIGVPAARDAAAKELLSGLAGLDAWNEASLGGLPEGSAWVPALTDGAGAVGLRASVEEDFTAPFIELPGDYEAYLASIPGKLRHEIRRKARRLHEELPAVRLVDATAETAGAALERFAELHRQSAGEKGRFMGPGMELFFRRLVEDLVPDGTLRLSFLEHEGKPLAAAIGFRWRDRFLLYNSAYDHEYRRLAPGMVLVAELVRAAIEEGRTAFDMLKGDLPYKYRFGARARPVLRLRVARS